MFRSKRMRVVMLAGAAALLATAGVAQMMPIGRGSLMNATLSLRAGQYLWAPELAPEGPMLVVVNVATQRLVAYRNGVPIAISTVSTGKPGHSTPLGIFSVLQKAMWHRSSTYSNAPMPFMQRLTWRGIALHGGKLPGYPASHGCIRLPHDFAKLLFGETALGMTVVIVNQPQQLPVGPTVASVRGGLPVQAPAFWQPEASPAGPVSIVVSGADRRMVVMRNGVVIGSAPVAFDGEVDHVQAYMLQDVGRGGEYHWRKMLLPGQSGADDAGFAPTAPARARGPSDLFRQALAGIVGPGTTMVVIPDTLGLTAPAYLPDAPSLDSNRVLASWRRDTSVLHGR